MIVKLNDQRLWVEGDKAYSIDEIKSRHEELLNSKSELESSIEVEVKAIELHSAAKSDFESKLSNVNYELEGVTSILDKILEAEIVQESEAEIVQELPEVESTEAPVIIDEDVAENSGVVVNPIEVSEPEIVTPKIISPNRKVKVILN